MKKIPKKHQEKKRSRLYRWFANISANLSSRYVKDCHPAFMTFIEQHNLITASTWYDAWTKRYEEIMKIIDSDAYRKYFYNAVDYKRGEVKPMPVKWYIRIFDKLVYSLSKAYVFVFERELYKKIKSFEKISKSVASLTKKMDEYIASTTSLQRLSRMQALGIISRESFDDDFDVIVNRVPLDIVEERRKNVGYSDGPQTFGSQWSMKRTVPLDVAHLIEKARE